MSPLSRHISHFNRIFMLGLPIIAGMLSQSLLNLVDAALVGQLGTSSLAGVGIGGYVNFVAISLILGISSSVQMLVARQQQDQPEHERFNPLWSGIAFAFCIALPLSILWILNAEWVIAFLTPEPAIQDIANQYFDFRVGGMFFAALLLTCRGWWNGHHQPGEYLRLQLLTHALNVIISYCLIFGYLGLPKMGAPGAGLGTTLSLAIAACLHLYKIRPQQPLHNSSLYRPWYHLPKQFLSQGFVLARLSLSHSTQQLVFALSICVLMWLIGKLGTDEQAVAYLLINISLFLILPAVGFGVASTSLISRAIGQQDYSEAYQWGWRVIQVAALAVLVLSLPLLVFPEWVLAIFISLPDVIETAALLLQLTAIAILVDTAAIVLTQSLYGANAGKHAVVITLSGQWLFFLPMAWFVGVYLHYGLLGIWLVQLVHRTLSAGLFMLIWQRRAWLHSIKGTTISNDT